MKLNSAPEIRVFKLRLLWRCDRKRPVILHPHNSSEMIISVQHELRDTHVLELILISDELAYQNGCKNHEQVRLSQTPFKQLHARLGYSKLATLSSTVMIIQQLSHGNQGFV
jgi:hypothetical protein